ncbi:MAG: DHA2 family efflux MFS transporter permease subunit [Terracidiphilus sp.]|jgi:DHA2 family multidrug resistance protein
MSAPRENSAAVEEWRPSFNPWFIAVAVMLATFVEVLDTSIVSVATPNIAGALAATNDEATRVLTCYLVANAIILPASGWLSLRFGRKRLLLVCTALFAVASFMCGSAPTMGFLLASSALQGIGGGAMVPLSLAILVESFPPAKRGMAMAMYMLGLVVAPAVGPVIGGWLTDNYSWRWIFYINVPVCLLAAFMMFRFVEDPPYVRDAKPGRLDAGGFILLGIWLAAFQFTLDDGQKKDWFGSTYITRLACISAIAFVFLLIRELRIKNPIVDLKIFLNRNFLVASAMITAFSIAMYSAVTGVPLFLMTLMGYTAELSGIATASRGIAAFVAAIVVGYMSNRVDPRWILLFGFLVFGIGTFQLGNITLGVSINSFVWPCVLQGLGMTCVYVTLTGMGLGTLRNEQMGNASGIFNLVRNLGGSIGISMTNTFVSRGIQSHYSNFIPHVTVYDPVYQQQSQMIQHGLTPLTGAHQAAAQTQGILQGILLQQAASMSYIDIFRWTAVLLVFFMPFAFLLKKVVNRGDVVVH